MKTQLQTLKGFRDFLPAEKRARNYVQEKVVETFKQFGFAPLETPTLEYSSLLLGKYGDEADKLVYSFTDRGGRDIALRYDQTVPTARVLAQYQNDLPKYFRRYQIQNVFRADKPQKGRYREFTQCDIDIFGATSGTADAEILACAYTAFQTVGFTEVELKVNDRQTLLAALTPFVTDEVDVFSIIQSVDKLDKMSVADVATELVNKGLTQTNAEAALEAITTAQQSDQLQQILNQAELLGVPKEKLVFTSTLARGLDYYTGMIFEISIPVEGYSVGSFGGGGRYDNLIDQLGGVDIPAVGVAFGFDRMVGAAVELGLIPDTAQSSTLLITNLEGTTANSLETADQLRTQGIATEVYPEPDKLQKQLKYANQNNYTWLVIIGEQEAAESKVTLKNMETGEQQLLTLSEISV